MKLDFNSTDLPWMPNSLRRTAVSCLDHINRDHERMAQWIWNTLRQGRFARGGNVGPWVYPYSYRLSSGEQVEVGEVIGYSGVQKIPWMCHVGIHVGNGFYVSLVRKRGKTCTREACGHRGPKSMAGQIRLDHVSRKFNSTKVWKRMYPGHATVAGPMETCFRALSAIGSYNYCAISGNCQHFVKSCTAKHATRKVYLTRGFLDTTLIITGSALVAANMAVLVPMIVKNAKIAADNKKIEDAARDLKYNHSRSRTRTKKKTK